MIEKDDKQIIRELSERGRELLKEFRAKAKGKFSSDLIAIKAYRAFFCLLHDVRRMNDRLNAIEQKGVSYRGVYQRSEDYKRGDLVTFGGSMWHATRNTTDEPGASRDWQLAVKKGRDA